MQIKRKTLILLIIFLSSMPLFSQEDVIIKDEKEIIYPFEINSNKLYFNWIKNNPNFDSVTVYAMGEATHGTKEFFDIKVQSFEYLVTHYNYRIFGIEASYGECCYINDYIQTGIGNIDIVMQYFRFWTWNTEEVKKLIIWMKDYNQNNVEKVVFYGFDMQYSQVPILYISDFLKPDTSAYVNELNEIIEPVILKNEREISMLLKKENCLFEDTVNIIGTQLDYWFEKYKSDLIKKYSQYRFNQLSFNLATYKQAIKRYNKSYNYRDSCMAENVLAIQRFENKKMFIWAHNGHINKTTLEYKRKRMGEYLHDELQNKYYSVGFVFSEGSFQSFVRKTDRVKKTAYKFQVTTLAAYGRNTFTKELDKLGKDIFFIDIQQSNNTFFTRDLRSYSIGAVLIKKRRSSLTINPKTQFDGIIYLNNTTRAIPINKVQDKL